MLSLVIFMVNGCSHAINKTLLPPADTKWVNFEIKNPSPYTKPFPLEVRYISHECLKKRVSGADGSVITEPGYNVLQTPMMQQNDDLWKAKIAVTGGGSCQWMLSSVNLGIEYIDATHIEKDLVPGTAVGATIAFDRDAYRNGQFDVVTGNNIILSENYFPLIEKNNMEHERGTLNLFGKVDFLQKKIIEIPDTLNITFTPKLDESKVVRMVVPTKYKVGEYFKIIYPDGTVVSDGSIHPDIKMVK